MCTVLWVRFFLPWLRFFLPWLRFFRAFSCCKPNTRVKLAKTGHDPHSSTLVICVVLLLFVLFYVLFMCKCVLYYCHRLTTQLQLTNISYHIISHHHYSPTRISYHITSSLQSNAHRRLLNGLLSIRSVSATLFAVFNFAFIKIHIQSRTDVES